MNKKLEIKEFEAFVRSYLEHEKGITDDKEIEEYVKSLSEEEVQKLYQAFTESKKKASKGAKLNYIKQLNHQCAEDEELYYFKKGGKTDCGCKKKAEGGSIKKNFVDEFKSKHGVKIKVASCGSKVKKHYWGGYFEPYFDPNSGWTTFERPNLINLGDRMAQQGLGKIIPNNPPYRLDYYINELLNTNKSLPITLLETNRTVTLKTVPQQEERKYGKPIIHTYGYRNRVKELGATSRENVKDILRKLKSLGYDIGRTGADGIWGKNTEKAYLQYLKDTNKPLNSLMNPTIQLVTPTMDLETYNNNNKIVFKKGGSLNGIPFIKKGLLKEE